MLRILQVIQWQDRRKGIVKKRFLLKWPPHLDALPELMCLFPNAKIIMTHRDLKPVLLSCLYLQACRFCVVCKEMDLHLLGRMFMEVIVARGREAIGNCMKNHKQVLNIHFRDYVQDYTGWIRTVFNFLEVECSSQDWLLIEKYLQESGEFRKNRAVYDPEYFGLSMEEVEKQLDFYTEFINNEMQTRFACIAGR